MCRKLLEIYKKCNGRRLPRKLLQMMKHGYFILNLREKCPVIAKRCQSTTKVLYAIFFKNEGPVVQVAIPKGLSIIGHLYKNYLLKKFKKHYERKRPKSGICNIRLLHDNVPAHKSHIVRSFLEKEKVHVLLHLTYSPDLSPCDFFVFPKLKKHLSGRSYAARNALGSAIYQCINILSPKTLYECIVAFKTWINRLTMCVC